MRFRVPWAFLLTALLLCTPCRALTCAVQCSAAVAGSHTQPNTHEDTQHQCAMQGMSAPRPARGHDEALLRAVQNRCANHACVQSPSFVAEAGAPGHGGALPVGWLSPVQFTIIPQLMQRHAVSRGPPLLRDTPVTRNNSLRI